MIRALALRNATIVGWHVRATITTGCHVPEDEDYRSVTIPEGAKGTLTGDMVIFCESADENTCKQFAQDARRVKKTLRQPEAFLHLHNPQVGYWDGIKQLKGDAFLAAHVSFTVLWDGIYEQEPETRKCGTYIPWLEFVSAKKKSK